MMCNFDRAGRIIGTVTIRVIRSNGEIEEETFHNLVVNAGKASVASLIGGLSNNAFTYIAIGSGTTIERATDTMLENEVKRKPATVSQTTTTVTNDTVELSATFSSADGLSGTTAITEYGVFNASNGGDMLARVVKAPKSMDWDAGDAIEVVWRIQIQ